MTWNIAAINNNPFEYTRTQSNLSSLLPAMHASCHGAGQRPYHVILMFRYWITHHDKDYNALMESVQRFIDAPGERDILVSEVFTPSMWAELKELMLQRKWKGIDATNSFWESDFSSRKIVSGFMKDKSIGDKRLASMPDRYTNTINTVRTPRVSFMPAAPMPSTRSWRPSLCISYLTK